MKKKNGFTLIELLAVVVILGIISAIATTIYSGYIQSTRKKTYIAAEKSMVSSTTSLLQQCREKEEDGEICELTDKSIPSVGANGIVYLKQLVENGYMKDVKDPKDTSKSCAEESYVLIKGLDSNSLNSKTEYQACLICGDYVSENCSAIDYAAVEKPIIVGKNSNGTNLISGGWLYKGNGTLEATYDKQLSGELNYKYKWYKDGNLIGGANKKKINVTEEGIYKVNVSNELETRNIDSDDFIVKTDNTAPANVDFSYLTTTKSITVTAIGTSLSKLSYSFSNNNGSTWTAYQDSNIYTFDKLKSGTYNVKVKVKNMSMLETISNVKSVILPVINVPTYTTTPSSGYSQSKTVTINYQSGYTNEYSINGGAWTKYSTPITFNSNGTIIARISDGINYFSGSTISVIQIDNTAPISSTFTYTKTGSSITLTATGVDNESGIYGYQFSKDNGNTWTGVQTSNIYTFNELVLGTTYNIKVRSINKTYENNNLNSLNYIDGDTQSIVTEIQKITVSNPLSFSNTSSRLYVSFSSSTNTGLFELTPGDILEFTYSINGRKSNYCEPYLSARCSNYIDGAINGSIYAYLQNSSNVTIKSITKNFKHEVMSISGSEFNLSDLPAGNYKLKFGFTGTPYIYRGSSCCDSTAVYITLIGTTTVINRKY